MAPELLLWFEYEVFSTDLYHEHSVPSSWCYLGRLGKLCRGRGIRINLENVDHWAWVLGVFYPQPLFLLPVHHDVNSFCNTPAGGPRNSEPKQITKD